MRDLQCATLELDEAWSFVGKKQKRVKHDDPASWAILYMDRDRREPEGDISYLVGKRRRRRRAFLADLRMRVVNRPQIRPTATGRTSSRRPRLRRWTSTTPDREGLRDNARKRGGAPLLAGPHRGHREDRHPGRSGPIEDLDQLRRAQEPGPSNEMRRLTRFTNGLRRRSRITGPPFAPCGPVQSVPRRRDLRTTPAMASG